MHTVITQTESAAFVRRLRFPLEIERTFQESYFAQMRSAVQLSILVSIVLSIVSGVVCAKTGFAFDFTRSIVLLFFAIAGIHVLLLGATLRQEFVAYWQPSLVAGTLILLAVQVIVENALLFPIVAVSLGVIVCRLQRLQFRWMAFLLLGLLVLSIADEVTDPTGGYTPEKVVVAIVIGLFLLVTPFFGSLKSERFNREEFLTKYLLAQDRNIEREKREQTEKMLHILSQAIGGIVHDLGNPLTTVQGGAETLQFFLEEDEPDKKMMMEFTEMITDGAQMLNYLRLSLMEQTRVLEGKPVPVEPKPTSIRHIIEAGTHYQKPRFVTGRHIVLHGDEMEVCVDKMRFITIFMNLIGNALKYSDGQVRVTWRTQAEQVLIAVLDQGQKGQGISKDQAEKLFVPFGRLDTHAQVEGTGLGLLSVRKIAEAHQGEVYIEGHTDGTNASATFSTAQGTYPTALEAGFLTAFVTACPLTVLSETGEMQETYAA